MKRRPRPHWPKREHWPAPTLKEMDQAERDARRARLIELARAVEDGWNTREPDLGAHKERTRAAGAE